MAEPKNRISRQRCINEVHRRLKDILIILGNLNICDMADRDSRQLAIFEVQALRQDLEALGLKYRNI